MSRPPRWYFSPSHPEDLVGDPDALLIMTLLSTDRAKEAFKESITDWIKELRKWIKKKARNETIEWIGQATADMKRMASLIDDHEISNLIRQQRQRLSDMRRWKIESN